MCQEARSRGERNEEGEGTIFIGRSKRRMAGFCTHIESRSDSVSLVRTGSDRREKSRRLTEATTSAQHS